MVLLALQALSCQQHILYMVLNVSGLNSSSAHALCHHLLYFIRTPRRGWGLWEHWNQQLDQVNRVQQVYLLQLM